MRGMIYLLVWVMLTWAYHTLVWPLFWEPAPTSRSVLAFDAGLSLLVTYYLWLHLERKKKYTSPKGKWGNVIREDAFRQIERNALAYLESENRTNCPACGGTGRRTIQGKKQEPCGPCMGTGFRKGWVERPFKVAFRGRNALFLGYNALTGEEVRLQGEECYCTTNVYGIQGSGKTKRVAGLINRQLFLDEDTSAIYFSLKASDAREIQCLAEAHGWTVHLMKGICLLDVFRSWSQLEQGLKMGMKAAGYQTRETFWFDRTMQLLRKAYLEILQHQASARLGPTLAKVLQRLHDEASRGHMVKADQIAVADIRGYLNELNDPLSPVRWYYDAGPEDRVPDPFGAGHRKGERADWSPLSRPKHLIIIPPTGTSRAGVVAATALKYASLLWFEEHKHHWQEANPAWRHRIAYIQDEGDNFAIVADSKDIDDVYATKTWRESGFSAWVYTQSKEFMKLVIGRDKAPAYLAVVSNTLTFAIPDEEVALFIKELPEYEYVQRTLNLNRRSNRYADHENLLSGNLLVTKGESLQIVKGPWITGEHFQKLPKGCAVFQRAGKTPIVVWIPYHDHVALTPPTGANGQ